MPLKALALSLLAVISIWGRFLSRSETLSAEAYVPTIHNLCRVGTSALTCQAPITQSLSTDAGAPGWQEGPANYFYRAARLAGRPRPAWNAYSGSGTPIGLDAITASTSPTRWYLSHHPGDQAHDRLILVRFLAWTFALVWAAGMLGVGTPGLALLALASALAPYATSYVDIVFLDIDLLAPWFLLLAVAQLTGRVSTRVAFLLAVGLGAGVASLGFLQSQVVYCTAVGLLALATAPSTRGRSLLLAFGFAAGELVFLPSWLPLVQNLDQFTTSRNVICIVSKSQGLDWFVNSVLGPPYQEYGNATFTLAGLALLVFTPGRWRFLGVYLLVLGAWLVFGLPAWACRLPLISGIRYVRHLVPHFQAAFLLLLAVTAWTVAEQVSRRAVLALAVTGAAALAVLRWAPAEFKLGLGALAGIGLTFGLAATLLPRSLAPDQARRSALLGSMLLLLAVGPYLLGGRLVPALWAGTAGGKQIATLPIRFDPGSPLEIVRRLSVEEDRRHISPGGLLYPNWAAALGVLDVLTIGAFYPVGFHELNAGLFPFWERDPQHGLNPDRFVPPPIGSHVAPGYGRMLAANRVSLLTFHRGAAAFPPAPSPYARERCKPVAWQDTTSIEAWLCPDIGGVGYFPSVVLRADSRVEALAVLQHSSPERIAALAVLGPELDLSGPGLAGPAPSPATGRVISVDRRGDDLTYQLEVERGGIFAIADSWFRGWHATVNGQPAGLSRCNVAFKAVNVPAGRVTVSLHFQAGT